MKLTAMALGLIAAALCAPALCTPAAAAETDAAPQVSVTLAGLDLASEADVTIARKRIDSAARHVCSDVTDPGAFNMRQLACITLARGDALRQLDVLHAQELARREQKLRGVNYAMRSR